MLYMLLDQPYFGLFIRAKRLARQDISTDPPRSYVEELSNSS